ncbi:MAG: DNA repair protein RecO [Hydrogenophaga sp.]|jgi:DNA repair protein RecO (recombination protein O)|uniref:DNA repair protein RecO n=1 Tax=Hydrogenophaga sp. TaxID=1904254 RepID=UPI000CC30A4A|nr:DNA repair protein RecO [Hydrogenophaga sp.]MDO9030436.1 DNA repair protein RecO [Hydrogenophaga sp.]MDZ4291121.1 DNA repair protein RecO [Hydrogenophaga sp.]PKO78176.1 MAG: DNA repair protein RecO [Betaproteobacteria bacterium HGW-Betaproteobacteria-15]
MATRRFSEEPAFVLHRYDWSESSLVLEVFTRHHGRIALVAKGVKRPTSQFRPVLLPLQPLHLSWGGDAEVRTLKSAQWQGGHVMPTGEALLSGCYLNELLMRLLARDDPHAALYDHYTLAVQLLAERADAQQLILRAFELLLLRDIGLLPDLAHEGNTLAPLQDGVFYVLGPESGLRAAHEDDTHALSGEQWCSLQIALDEADPLIATLRACVGCQQALQPQLRNLLHYHSGVRVFKTRQLMLDVQAMGRPRASPEAASTNLQTTP